MNGIVNIPEFAMYYVQFIGILLLGYSFYLKFNLRKKKMDYLEKILTIFGLGMIPYFVVFLILIILKVPENDVPQLSTGISLVLPSIYIFVKNYKERG